VSKCSSWDLLEFRCEEVPAEETRVQCGTRQYLSRKEVQGREEKIGNELSKITPSLKKQNVLL
jgi:hypothetical protein